MFYVIDPYDLQIICGPLSTRLLAEQTIERLSVKSESNVSSLSIIEASSPYIDEVDDNANPEN